MTAETTGATEFQGSGMGGRGDGSAEQRTALPSYALAAGDACAAAGGTAQVGQMRRRRDCRIRVAEALTAGSDVGCEEALEEEV